jgi:hypothetical protein
MIRDDPEVFSGHIKKTPQHWGVFQVNVKITFLQFTNILRSRTFGTAHNIKTDPITLGQ